MVTEYWDVFCEDVLYQPFRVFSFQIDTVSDSPICCKPSRYSLHESEFMPNLVERLYENDVVEEDDGTFVALVVLAAKLHQ